MLKNWLQPSDEFAQEPQLPNHSFAANCTHFLQEAMDLTSFRVAILGIGNQSDMIRRHLMSYDFPFQKTKVVDLGNCRKNQLPGILPILKEMQDSGIVTIILDCEDLGPKLIFDHFESGNNPFQISIVDEIVRTPAPSNQSLDFLKVKLYSCKQIHHMATQMHRTQLALEDYDQNVLRLAEVRHHKEKIEPKMRNCNGVYFNLNAIRKSDAPGKSGTNPSGLFAEEASQLCRYAGISERISSLMIGGFWHLDSQTAELISQMIWYFLQGFDNRIVECTESQQDMQKYVVDLKNNHLSLTFLKSNRSGRWWVEIPTEVSGEVFNILEPCTYHDYHQACGDELTDSLIVALENRD